MKDISLGSHSLMKLKATTRHICVKFVSRRSSYGFGRTSTWSCKAMGVRPGIAGLLIDIECSRVRDSSWMYLTSLVTT